MVAQESPVRFKCPHCEVGLRAALTEAGSRRKCPKCAQVFTIPGRSKYRGRTAQSKTENTDEASIPVVCTVCQTRMFARPDQVGQFIECPDCFSPSAVKEPIATPKPKPKPKVLVKDDDVGVRPSHDTNTQRGQAYELLAEADRQLEEESEEGPQPPAIPLWTGVPTFPFYWRMLPLTVGMALSLTIALGLMKIGRDLQGGGALIAPIVMVLAVVVLGCVSVATMACLLNILENTVQGEDDADYRPEGGLFAFLDWFGETFYLMNAICLSAIPAAILAHFAPIPFEIPLWRLVPVLATVVFLPLVLLSMLEGNSAAVPFSKPIWFSLVKLPGTWFLYYLFALSLAAGASLCAITAWELTGREWKPPVLTLTVALVFGAVVCGAIYFRLLGRLGWILTQEIIYEADDQDDGRRANRETKDGLLEPSETSAV